MKPIDYSNPNRVSYFELSEYVDKIKLQNRTLANLDETNQAFDEYMKALSKYDDYQILHFWIDSLAVETSSSNQIESHFIRPMDVLNNNVYFDNLNISNIRIKQLHDFVMNLNTNYDNKHIEGYRKPGEEVKVSARYENGYEKIFWWGANSEDIPRFMNDLIDIYKTTNFSTIYSSPFLKSSLVSLLFVRIHPFHDGNGRTSRLLYNIKFTEFVNKLYDMKLRLCPLNISQIIELYKYQYTNIIDNIYFDLEHDCNDEINDWFNFILNRVNEALYYNTNRMKKLSEFNIPLEFITQYDFDKESNKMNLSRVRKFK